MKRLAPTLLVASVVLSAALGGCGSSGPNQADFIKKADGLCRAEQKRQESLKENLVSAVQHSAAEVKALGKVSGATRKELARAVERVANAGEADLSKLRGLDAPSEHAKLLAGYLKTAADAFLADHTYAAALLGNEPAATQAAAEKGGAGMKESVALAKRYGFKVCGAGIK